MKARIQLATVKLLDPRVVRLLITVLILALAIFAPTSAAYATACPGGASGGACGSG